jgi:Ser/Thr protein kinase RdoA (MazF antagonist)
MAKKSTFESLPREIRTALYRVDEPETFSVERNRFEAITVINKRISRVYKYVRKNKKNVALLEREIDNLIRLRDKKIAAPTPLNRMPLKGYDSVVLGYVDGDILVNNVLPKHIAALGESLKKIHTAFEKEGKNKLADWSSAKVLKPYFAKANADDFSPEVIAFARSIVKSLREHELNREDMTFVHADSELSNVVFDGSRAVLIDWAKAGFASKYFDLGVGIHSLLSEKKAMQPELLRAYLGAYFGEAGPTERDIELIDLHVKLRFMEAATAYLQLSKEDQLLGRTRILKHIDESHRKALKFSIVAATK